MKPTHPIRRAAAILAVAALACTAAPAALAGIGPVGGTPAALRPNRAGYSPAPAQIHTIVTGGTPGWQITLIATAAAILAAAVAVILNRAHTARRHPAASSG